MVTRMLLDAVTNDVNTTINMFSVLDEGAHKGRK